MSTQMQEQYRQTSPLAKFAEITPAQFEQEIAKAWQAVDQIRQVVSDQVSQELLSPVQGLGVLACATGQVFGYAEFHGQPGPADTILRALSSGGMDGSQVGQRR